MGREAQTDTDLPIDRFRVVFDFVDPQGLPWRRELEADAEPLVAAVRRGVRRIENAPPPVLEALLTWFALTTGSGSYGISGIYPGEYRVFVSASEYRPEVYDDVPCEGAYSCGGQGTAVVVADGETRTGIDFALNR